MADIPSSTVTAPRRGVDWLARRGRDLAGRMTVRALYYFYSPMVSPGGEDGGRQVAHGTYSYVAHLILACFSEALIRVILSFVFVMALAGVNGGVINFTAAALAKGLSIGAVIMLMGRCSAYSRLENVVASWWPSSTRMFDVTGAWGPKAVQPYADAIHVICYSISQYGGSLLGLGLAMWVSNTATMILGQPNATFSAFGVFGTYVVTQSDLWLIEIYGSAVLTFTWLMLVVHRVGAKHHIYVGLAMGFVASMFALVTISASGANFDFLHYAALRTLVSRQSGVNSNVEAAYFVAPLIGAAVAWVGYIVVAALSFAGGYSKPGIDLDDLNASDPMYAGRRFKLAQTQEKRRSGKY